MRVAICHALVWVASERLQEKFVINADKVNYLTIDDLLSSADFAVRHYQKCSGLSPLNAELFHLLDSALDDFVCLPQNDRIVTSEGWKRVREAASNCLGALGFDLSQFESSEMHID